MKKIILSLVFGVIAMLSMNSCITPAYSQDVAVSESNGEVNVDLIIRYGTPYYFEGSLLYYLYDSWYYYPYRYNNMWYYYRYSRPFPVHHGYRFTPYPNHRPYHIDRGLRRPSGNNSYRGFGGNRNWQHNGRVSSYNRPTSRPNIGNRGISHGGSHAQRPHNGGHGRGFGGRR